MAPLARAVADPAVQRAAERESGTDPGPEIDHDRVPAPLAAPNHNSATVQARRGLSRWSGYARCSESRSSSGTSCQSQFGAYSEIPVSRST